MLAEHTFQKFNGLIAKNDTLILLHDKIKLKLSDVIFRALNEFEINNYQITDCYLH
jgi:hypothetical protein